MSPGQPTRPLPAGYELIRSLGSGGFGEVLLARQASLNRLVAIKRVHAYALADPEALERFRREARVLATLDHPCIVRIYDFRREGTDATLIMEYVDGETLSEHLRAGPMPIAAALVVLRDVADALSTAARAGVVHRDVKPDNVFVVPEGRAKLGDFGLARVVTDASVFRTATTVATGTPAYSAPESEFADHAPDERSDAYSFAVLGYEVLTGRLPFRGLDVFEMIAAHAGQAPPPPDSILKGFPSSASQALLAGLAKDPNQRLLPVELVTRLAAVPVDQWPTEVGTTAAAAGPIPQVTVARGSRVAQTLAETQPAADVPHRRRPRRVGRTAVAAALLLVAIASAVAVASHVAKPPARLELGRINSTVVPTSGRCPAAEFEFTARIQTNGEPGVVRLQWLRPGGRETQPATLHAEDGQHRVTAILRFTVTGMQPLAGRGELRILSPDPRTERTAFIRYECSTSGPPPP